MDEKTKLAIAESAVRIQKIQEQLREENEVLFDILRPLATTIEVCAEIVALLPECSARFDVWRIQQTLKK